MSAEGIGRDKIEDLAGLVAERMLVAQRERNAELVEEVDEGRLARVFDARIAQRRENFRQRPAVVERPMRSARMNAVTFGEMLELPTGRVQRARQRQGIVGEEVVSARQLRRHPAQDREIERVAIMRNEDIGPAEFAELGPHRLEVGRVGDVGLGDSVRPEGAGSDGDARLHQSVVLIDDPAVSNANSGELHDLGAIHILVRRLEIDRGEVAESVGEPARAHQLRSLEQPEPEAERRQISRGDANGIGTGSAAEIHGPDPHLEDHFPGGDFHSAEPRHPDRLSGGRPAQNPRGECNYFLVRRRISQIFLMFFEDGAIRSDLLGQNILDQWSERPMTLAERRQIFQGVKPAPDFFGVAVLARKRTCHVLELVNETAPRLLGPGARTVEQRLRKNSLVEKLLPDLVRGIGDHAQRSEHVGDDLVVGEGPALRQAAGDARIKKGRFETAADFVGAIKESYVTPAKGAVAAGAIASQVVHDPRRFGVIVGKSQCLDGKRRAAHGLLWLSIGEDCLIERDQLPRHSHDSRRAAVILAQVNQGIGPEAEVFLEMPEDLRIGARPRIHRLLVVADSEDVAMVLRQATHDCVLDRVQILEFVDQHDVPALANLGRDIVHSQQLGRP